MIAKNPHPVFAFTWLAWLGCVVAAWLRPDPTFALIVLLAFLPIEATGVAWNTGLRDTFSEVFTWIQRYLSKHVRVARGWNAVLLLVILAITGLLARTVDHYSGSWLAAGVTFVLTTLWLHDHLFSPDEHG